METTTDIAIQTDPIQSKGKKKKEIVSTLFVIYRYLELNHSATCQRHANP